MGILDILKRGKSDSKPADMPKAEFPELSAENMPPLPESSLPPLPGAEEGMSIPAIPPPPGMGDIGAEREETGMDENMPDIPDLPKMPEPVTKGPAIPDIPKMPEPEMKGPDMPNIPKAPIIRQLPKTEIKIPTYEPEKKTRQAEMPELPALPASNEFVPERIPPLEGIGKVPEFNVTEQKKEHSPIQDIEDEFPMPTALKRETRDMPARRSVKGPIFVKVSSFKDIMMHIEDSLARFQEEDDIFFRVTDVKNSQDKTYERYRLTLEDMQRKLLFIDKTLFEKK